MHTKNDVMKFMIVFWALFALFFCIPFPIIIYLNTRESFGEPATSLSGSYIYLGISIAMWIYVIGFFINELLIENFRQKRSINEISKNGIPREAKIVEYQLLKFDTKKKANIITVILSFENLQNVLIETEMTFFDMKPLEKRFEKGKTVAVLLSKNLAHEPYIVLKKQEATYNKLALFLRFLGITALCAFVGGMYFYFYQTESFDFGWRFLTYMHPIIFCAFMFLTYILIYQFIVKRFLFRSSKENRILFSGRSSQAEIVGVNQTGLEINDQPQISFQLRYQDFKGQEHFVEYKEIIDLLNLSEIPRHGFVEILYDENNPNKVVIPKLFEQVSNKSKSR